MVAPRLVGCFLHPLVLALQPCLLLSPCPRTGRNSFYVGTCQDEPEQLDDWNRIAELQQRNRVCPPHLKTCYPLESRVSSRVPCQGPTPAGFPLSPGPPSPVSQPAKEGDLLLVNYQAGRNSGGGSVEGWSLHRSLGMAPAALVQGVGRKTTAGEPFAIGRLQMPGQ